MKTCFARRGLNRGPLVEFGELVGLRLATLRPEYVPTDEWSLSQPGLRAQQHRHHEQTAASASESFDAMPVILSQKARLSRFSGEARTSLRTGLCWGCWGCCWIVEQESHNYTKQRRRRQTDTANNTQTSGYCTCMVDASSGLRRANGTGYACRALKRCTPCLTESLSGRECASRPGRHRT